MGNDRQRAIMLPIETTELTPTYRARYQVGLAVMIVFDAAGDGINAVGKKTAGYARFATETGYCGNSIATNVSRIVTIAEQEWSEESRDVQLDLDHLPDYSRTDDVWVGALSETRRLYINGDCISCRLVVVWDRKNGGVHMGVAVSTTDLDREVTIYYLD